MKVVSDVATKFVTSGNYERTTTTYASNFDLTSGTEVEVTELATSVKAGASIDSMFSWVRFWWFAAATDEPTVYEWYIIRCLATDAVQDLSSSTVVEDLQREKKILARGFVAQASINAGRSPKIIKNEFYNIKLQRGWELRLLLSPMLTNTAGHVKSASILEWRELGLD